MKRTLSYFLRFILLSLFILPNSAKADFYDSRITDLPVTVPTPIETGDIIVKILDKNGNYTYESMTEAKYTQMKALEATDPYSKSPFPRMEYVQKEYVRYVDPVQSNNSPLSWGPGRIGSQVLVNAISNPREIVVAVLDTGVDSNHPFLKKRMVRGHDFTSNDSDPMDEHGHGTHVSGIIADTTSENVKIMPIRVLDKNGRGGDLNISNGIRFAADNGADVINMSLGGPGQSPMMREAIEYAISKNVLVIVAAGNERDDTKHYYPASDEKVIVVAATNQVDLPAHFSNYGTSVDVAAPGEGINSTIPGGNYGVQSGTSMAAPFVSGVAALLLTMNPGATIEEIENLLFMYTDDKWQTGRDIYYGEGIINVSNYLTSTEPLSVISPNANSLHAEKIELKLMIHDAVGKMLYVTVGGHDIIQRKITKDGYQTVTVPLDNIQSGEQMLKIGFDNGENHKLIPVSITKQTNQFTIKNIAGKLDTSFEIMIYGIKDGEVLNENLHPSSMPIYQSSSLGDTAHIEGMDINVLKEDFEHIVAVAKSMNPDTPVYVRELVTNGNHLFEPTTIQKITFENKLPGQVPLEAYRNNIRLSFKGILLPKTLLFITPNNEKLVMYVDKGNHLVNFFSEDFFFNDFIKNEKEVNLAVTNENTFKYNFISHSEGVGMEGFMEGDYAYLRLYRAHEPFIEVADYALDQGNNSFRISKGQYRAVISHHVRDDRKLAVYRDINEQNAAQNSVFDYGGAITGEFKLNYDAGSLSGKIRYKDSFGNTLYTNSSYYDYLGYSDDLVPAFDSEEWSRLILANEVGEEWYAWVNGDNDFTFHSYVPDGTYTLRFNYENDLYPVKNAEMKVAVENGQFIKDDYIRFNPKSNIPVNKVWTVTVNREFKPEEVVETIVRKGTDILNTTIEYKPREKELLIYPDVPYEYGTQYEVDIHLYNGKKYRMRFTTVENANE